MLQSLETGTGFSHIPNIVYRHPSGVLMKTLEDYSVELSTIPKLDHSLYSNFRRFPPTVEVSRGCPYACEFCTSVRTKLRRKSVSYIVAQMEMIRSLYGSNSMSVFFQAPLFRPGNSQLAKLPLLICASCDAQI
jgi:radical SAM superfamily enzyme YgiQ (UPF0313 family)